jgi:hypothetical protein
MEEIAPMIATVIMIIGTVTVIKILSNNKRLDKLAKMHADLQTRVLDRFGSAPEMLEYLRTDSGKQLLDAPVIERGSPYARILGSVQAGIVLALAGVAFLVTPRIANVPDKTAGAFTFVGVLGLALGIGFVASAWAAHKLSKSYGLIDNDTQEPKV